MSRAFGVARQRALYYAVADVHDALTSSRPYRAGRSPAEALGSMHENECRGLDREALGKLSGLISYDTYQG